MLRLCSIILKRFRIAFEANGPWLLRLGQDLGANYWQVHPHMSGRDCDRMWGCYAWVLQVKNLKVYVISGVPGNGFIWKILRFSIFLVFIIEYHPDNNIYPTPYFYGFPKEWWDSRPSILRLSLDLFNLRLCSIILKQCKIAFEANGSWLC